jgi:hypothetical protein
MDGNKPARHGHDLANVFQAAMQKNLLRRRFPQPSSNGLSNIPSPSR